MRTRTRALLLLALGLGLALAAVCLYFAFKGYDTLYRVESKEEKPHLYVVPRPLSLTPCTIKRSTTLTYSRFSVDVPWSGKEDETQYEKFVQANFNSGIAVLLGEISAAEGPVATLRQQGDETRRGWEATLSPNALKSQYDFYETMLNTTPESISIRTNPRKLIGLQMILFLKDLMLRGDIDVYSFGTETVKGFQINRGSYDSIEILAFDSADTGLAITTVPPKHSNVRISQEEMDCVIQSIRPADEPR